MNLKRSILSLLLMFFLFTGISYAVEKVDINTASKEELQQVTGIGSTIASAIVKYRTEKGAFKNIEELTNVKGIGKKKLSNISDQIKVVPE